MSKSPIKHWWSPWEAGSFLGILWVVSLVITLAKNIVIPIIRITGSEGDAMTISSWAYDLVTDPFFWPAFGVLVLMVLVSWDYLPPWLTRLLRSDRNAIRLGIEFDHSDPKCRPSTSMFSAGIFRVRVESDSPAVSSAKVRVECLEIRLLNGSDVSGGDKFSGKPLKPADSKGPRFSIHGGRAYVDFVRFDGSMNRPGKIHLCHCDKDTSDLNVDSGRYLITLQADGRDCVPCEQTFFVRLSGVTGTIAPYLEGHDYSVVDEWRRTVASMVSMGEACKTVDHANSWRDYCERQLTMALQASEHLNGFLDAVEERMTDDGFSNSVRSGLDYLVAIKPLITDEQLR